MSSAPAL